MARYSQLKPLSHDELKFLTIQICNFFNTTNNKSNSEILGIPTKQGSIQPLSFFQFLDFMKKHGHDLNPKMYVIRDLINKLVAADFLVFAGTKGSPGIGESYWFHKEFTNIEKNGSLWMGKALGLEFVGRETSKNIVKILGTTKAGDWTIGTGILVTSKIVLTCKHVLEDIDSELSININNENISYAELKSHDLYDVGFIVLSDDYEIPCKDIAFREAEILDHIITLGYPKVPRAITTSIIYHRGEICGQADETIDKYPLDLFSAIARPGNSGGPLISIDGNIVGIVTQSLEREKEDSDPMAPLPFFASVPVRNIIEAWQQLIPDHNIPIEDYS